MKARCRTYRIITGRVIDLGGLDQNERGFLSNVLKSYEPQPEWSSFAARWISLFQEASLQDTSPVYRVCQDLEARLGIAQGKVAPPDYRDYLSDLIDEKYGSRYKFCKDTGIDPGHLSRVFASRTNLSLESLEKILQALDSVLVIQPEKTLRNRTSPRNADRCLEAVIGK